MRGVGHLDLEGGDLERDLDTLYVCIVYMQYAYVIYVRVTTYELTRAPSH